VLGFWVAAGLGHRRVWAALCSARSPPGARARGGELAGVLGVRWRRENRGRGGRKGRTGADRSDPTVREREREVGRGASAEGSWAGARPTRGKRKKEGRAGPEGGEREMSGPAGWAPFHSLSFSTLHQIKQFYLNSNTI
jgi:hypothetical protein